MNGHSKYSYLVTLGSFTGVYMQVSEMIVMDIKARTNRCHTMCTYSHALLSMAEAIIRVAYTLRLVRDIIIEIALLDINNIRVGKDNETRIY